MSKPAYRRVLVKVSGEALMGTETYGLHAPTIGRIADDLAAVRQSGVDVAVVVGGGNLIRGAMLAETGINRAAADQMGMLATVMNALALESAIQRTKATARVLSAVAMPSVCESYSRQTALKHLREGHIVLLAGGTGQPFFTTDTGAACGPRSSSATRSSRPRMSTASMIPTRRPIAVQSGSIGLRTTRHWRGISR
jgi:uridylate kinase